ncbi:MAG: glycosyltransferase family 2 protein [Pseudomonadota bacterium]
MIVDNKSDEVLEASGLGTNIPIVILRNDELRFAGVNRNLGARAASGEIICFLDDDDTYTPTKMTDLVAEFERHPDLDFVYGASEQIDAQGQVIVRSFGPVEIRTYLLYQYVHVNALAVRKSVFATTEFDPVMATYEEVDFIGQLIKHHKGRAIDRVHAVWNRDDRPDQLTNRNFKRSYEQWKILCQKYEAEIRSSRVLSKNYYKKMFALSCIRLAVFDALKYLYLYVRAFTLPREDGF